jgi:hypothetical protein
MSLPSRSLARDSLECSRNVRRAAPSANYRVAATLFAMAKVNLMNIYVNKRSECKVCSLLAK